MLSHTPSYEPLSMPALGTAQIVEFDGESHVVFFTRTNIRAGQELTFDYRFKVEEDDRDRVPCHCGAPDCKGEPADPGST